MFTRVLEAHNQGIGLDEAVNAEAARVREEIETLLADPDHLPVRLNMTGGSQFDLRDARRVRCGRTTLTVRDAGGRDHFILALIHVTSAEPLGTCQ